MNKVRQSPEEIAEDLAKRRLMPLPSINVRNVKTSGSMMLRKVATESLYLELSPDGKLRFPTFRKLVK